MPVFCGLAATCDDPLSEDEQVTLWPSQAACEAYWGEEVGLRTLNCTNDAAANALTALIDCYEATANLSCEQIWNGTVCEDEISANNDAYDACLDSGG